MAVQTAAINEDKLNAFMGQVVGELGATVNAGLIVIGDKLGLYKAMAQAGPITSAELAEKTGMTKKDATGALEDFIGLVVKHLKKGNKVRVTGLGIFQVRNRPARMGRNPATGEAIKIKASKKVAFRVAKDLKEAI